MLDMYPKEHEKKSLAWKKLKPRLFRKPSLADIRMVLQAEAELDTAISPKYKSTSIEINKFIELSTPEMRADAKAWFAKMRSVCVIAQSNTKKSAHLNANKSNRGSLNDSIRACDGAISVLSK